MQRAAKTVRGRGAVMRGMGCLLLLVLGGCAPLAALGYKFSGAPTVKAKYVPPRQETLVLVENFDNPAAMGMASDRLDRQVHEELAAHHVVPLVAPERLFDLRSRHPDDFRTMTIPAVGKALGARQVVYVHLIEFTLEPTLGSEMAKARAEARVRVVDVESGQTRWPDEAGGYSVRYEAPYAHLSDGVTETTLREQMASALGNRIGKLFYSWKSDDVDGTEPKLGE